MKIKNIWTDEFEEVTARRRSYANNHNLAIQLTCSEGMYATLTTNLGEKLPEDMAYVDTNNLPNAEEFIEANGLGEPTGAYRQSGYCIYPLYKFNLAMLS